MGKSNRQQWDPFGKRNGQAPPGGPPPGPADLLVAAVHCRRTGDDAALGLVLDRLTAMSPGPVAGEVEKLLALPLAHLWKGGWQPADLARLVQRELGAPESDLLRCVLAADAARYETLGRRVAPQWMDQLDAVGASRWWEPSRSYLLQLDLHWRAALLAAVRLVHRFESLPRLPVLTPPPDQWREGMTASVPSNLPVGLLDKVRSLLAKAESTTFDAEAEAFTAKAQELMARHRIDRAVLAAAEPAGDGEPIGRRITVDDPYADAKALLVAEIADANGGRAVWSKGLGFSTVFAHAGDHDAVEELFTSLLVQATAALRREGSKQDAWGRSRTTRFRRSFLTAFAVRIGQRLHEAVEETVAEAETEHGGGLLPVLAARDEAVRSASERAFPTTQSFGPRATDGEGWHAGKIFADRADVGVGEPLERRAAS